MTSEDPRDKLADEPFSYRVTKSGLVLIDHHGRTVTTLGGAAAKKFLSRVEGADTKAQQLAMAKATGHYKHGNERQGKEPRPSGLD